MTNKRRVHIVLDTLMLVLLPVLMAYSLVGEEIHEWLGVTLFTALLLHNILNFNWYKNISRGKLNPSKLLKTVINALLIILMFGMMASGVAMSQYVFTFLPVKFSLMSARIIHLSAAYWFLFLTSFHLGMHWKTIGAMMKKKLRLQKNSTKAIIIFRGIVALISFFGIYSLSKSGALSYMFIQSQFAYYNFDEPLVLFIASYMSMMILFVSLGYITITELQNNSKKKGSI